LPLFSKGKRIYIFLSAVILYSLLWHMIAESTLNRIGYMFWIYSSVEDLLNYNRVQMLRVFFRFLMPIIIGFLAVRWSGVGIKK